MRSQKYKSFVCGHIKLWNLGRCKLLQENDKMKMTCRYVRYVRSSCDESPKGATLETPHPPTNFQSLLSDISAARLLRDSTVSRHLRQDHQTFKEKKWGVLLERWRLLQLDPFHEVFGRFEQQSYSSGWLQNKHIQWVYNQEAEMSVGIMS